MPLYGNELSRDIRPAQAGLGRVVALAKDGDFVGRAAIEAGQSDDAPVLVGLAAGGRRAARAHYEVYDGDGADAARVGEMRRGGEHHGPIRVPSGGDLALRAPSFRGCRPMKRGRSGQSRIRPRDFAGQREIHLRNARTESIAPQRLCKPRR